MISSKEAVCAVCQGLPLAPMVGDAEEKGGGEQEASCVEP